MELTTWANGFGSWHARVARTPNCERLAREAILAELWLRDERFEPSKLRLVEVESDATTITYEESWPEDTPGISYAMSDNV